MGLFRKYLLENFGVTAARAILTQFGFAHGWRMAEAMASEFTWENETEWQLAGTRIHALGGHFRVGPGPWTPLAESGTMIIGSYEAEQHILHLGRSDEPTCWTIAGLLSGYLSRTTGDEIYVLEGRCGGKGDASCHLIARTAADWGEERGSELGFFNPALLNECLDVSLSRIVETLKTSERALLVHRRALREARGVGIDGEPVSVVQSTAMARVIDLATRVAKVDATVLITGESGVGKERIARLVHGESTRAAGPFIAVNCGAITETLLESELFSGHVRGAFTGANSDRAGLFEAANGGTLLLDEIGEVSTAMQVKLLRVLQEREVRRVGENKSRRVDVRILATTNRDLAHGVAGGDFRQDLYYRLKVVELHVPPLRDRRDDILPLAREARALSARSMKREIVGLAPGAADLLLRYAWPGNVRELENAMERAVALARGNRVEAADLPDEVRAVFSTAATLHDGVRPLEDIEREYILAALLLNDGNQTRTAEQLQIGSSTLYRKLKRYDELDGGQTLAE